MGNSWADPAHNRQAYDGGEELECINGCTFPAFEAEIREAFPDEQTAHCPGCGVELEE